MQGVDSRMALGVAVCFLLHACAYGQRSEFDRAIDAKSIARETKAQIIRQANRGFSTGFRMDSGGVNAVIRFSGEYVSRSFELLPDTNSEIKPENFARMWGTRKGMAALAHGLGELFAGEEIDERAFNPAKSDPYYGNIEGIALFENEDGTYTLLSVRFDDDKPVLERLTPNVIPSDCTATVPGHTCGCTAKGDGASCDSGTDPGTGNDWAKCTDGPKETNRTQAECTGKGGRCSCKVIAL